MEPMSSFLVQKPPKSLHLECLDDTVATSDVLGDGLDALGTRKLRGSSSNSCNDHGVEGEVFWFWVKTFGGFGPAIRGLS